MTAKFMGDLQSYFFLMDTKNFIIRLLIFFYIHFFIKIELFFFLLIIKGTFSNLQSWDELCYHNLSYDEKSIRQAMGKPTTGR